MSRICSLKPNVSREEAIAEFCRGATGRMRDTLFGQLRGVAEFYVPFLLFNVKVVNHGDISTSLFGLDGVNGTLDLYRFDNSPAETETTYLETRNFVPSTLDDAAAIELVITKVRRVVFNSGFFRLRDLSISAERQALEIHVPYWVGFRGKNTANFIILDAVRRKIEGAKVRHILHSWLLPSTDGTLVTPAATKVLS